MGDELAPTAGGEDGQAEDSPLEIIRNPHEGVSVMGSTEVRTQQYSPKQQAAAPTATATGGVGEVLGSEAAAFPPTDAMAGFAEMDGFIMGDLDDTFWTSNLFDPAMFPEL